MKAKSHVAVRVQAARKARGYSKELVAQQMSERGHEWTPTTVTNVENDRKTGWSDVEMGDLAEILDVQPAELFPGLRRSAMRGVGLFAVLPIRVKRSTSDVPVGITQHQPVTATTPEAVAA